MTDDRVYFFHDPASAKVKIGHSAHVDRRLAEVRALNPADVRLLGTLPGGEEAERFCHGLFAEYRHRGEWFDARPDLLRAVRALLVRGGRPCTVEDELNRRDGCRHGLRGVEVAMRGHGLFRYHVHGSAWGASGGLRLVLYPLGTETVYPPEVKARMEGALTVSMADLALGKPPAFAQKWAPAGDVYLMAEWPVVCRCWCDDPED